MEVRDRSVIGATALREVKANPVKWKSVFALKITLWIVWTASGIYGLCVVQGFVTTLLLQLLLGAAYAHGVELQHQALHQSGFSSRRANRLFGVLLGLPMLVAFSSYQDSHLYHHRKLGTPDDTEFFDYGNPSDRNFLSIFKHFFLINHFCDFLKNVIDALIWRTFKTKLLSQNPAKIRFEYLLIGVVFFGSFLFSLHYESEIFVKCWVVPLFFFAAPIHALIELPEHFECERGTRDVFQNTRSIKTHPIATWFTNGNNYHVEHHWLASLPIEKLVDIHMQIDEHIVHLSPSYRSFYRSFFTNSVFRKSRSRTGSSIN
jgi:fatty acid desaturase